MRIISRAEWGANPARTRVMVPQRDRSELTVHNDGDVPIRYAAGSCRDVCYPKIRGTQRFHQITRGWADIAYNFWVCNAHGNIFEGRGWDVLGAHAGPGNRPGIGVQVHIGGSQAPSEAALTALLWLHAEAARRYGRVLRIGKHSDWMSTSCPGVALTAWVQANRNRVPVTNTTPTPPAKGDSDMRMTDSLGADKTAADGTQLTVGEALSRGDYAYRMLQRSGYLTEGALKRQLDELRAEIEQLKKGQRS